YIPRQLLVEGHFLDKARQGRYPSRANDHGKANAIRSALRIRQSHQLVGEMLTRSSAAVATSREGHRSPRAGPGRPAAKAWEDENRPQLSLTGPRLAKLLQVLIGLLRPQRVERLRPLRGLQAWLDRLAMILSVDAWSVVAASVHSRASLRYSSRCRVSSVSSAALTQFSAWYS